MNIETKTTAERADFELELLLEMARRDTAEIIEQASIPLAVAYFAELRDAIRPLQDKMTALQRHIDGLSHEQLPTMFGNQDVKTINVRGVGVVSVNDRWSASMLDKERAFEWLEQTGNHGLIIETVNAQTLGAFAKEEAIAGRPLPEAVFRVSATPYISITKS